MRIFQCKNINIFLKTRIAGQEANNLTSAQVLDIDFDCGFIKVSIDINEKQQSREERCGAKIFICSVGSKGFH